MLKKTLASALLKIQKNRGLTVEQFAALLQLPCATVRATLQGRADLPICTVEKIARQLQLNPTDLVSDFHAEQAQIESLAYILQNLVNLPLSNCLEMAKVLREMLSLLDTSTTDDCQTSPVKRQEELPD